MGELYSDCWSIFENIDHVTMNSAMSLTCYDTPMLYCSADLDPDLPTVDLQSQISIILW